MDITSETTTAGDTLRQEVDTDNQQRETTQPREQHIESSEHLETTEFDTD